jgi:hypothetical protein
MLSVLIFVIILRISVIKIYYVQRSFFSFIEILLLLEDKIRCVRRISPENRLSARKANVADIRDIEI